MGMAGKIKFSFHHKVLFSLLLLCWTLLFVFTVFQYNRERTFRSELMNLEMQMHNGRIIDEMSKGGDVDSIMSRIAMPMHRLRLTIIDKSGNVLFDSNGKSGLSVSNHNNRPEVVQARRSGTGYAVERKSSSDDTQYFYSATLADDGIVVRTAAAYDHDLRDFLKADLAFLWVMFLLTAAASAFGFFIARRIHKVIANLSNFADKAGRGERILENWDFPTDELGNIAANIVKLYVERDQRHQEAISQERDKVRLKKQLTNNINHELKTPVASIRMCATLLRDHPDLSKEKSLEFLTLICAETERLSALLDDVASLTRMDDGAKEIEMEKIDLSELVTAVVDNERLRTDMSIVCNVPHVTITGNRRLLESVFRNLIDNAINYSGGSQIVIEADSNGNFIVSDNGEGVPDEHLDRIFERFYRVDKGRSRQKGGTGLGLSIVKNAIAVHGGSITATNDNGLRFNFHLG